MAHIRKIADGKYLVRVSKGTGSRRRYINKTIRGTRKDASTYAREQETLLDTGRVPKSKLTFKEFAAIWLTAIKPGISPNTWHGYDGHIRRHTAAIAALEIDRVETPHIQAIYNALAAQPSTVHHLHSTLNALFNDALRQHAVRENPCKYTMRPRLPHAEIVVMDQAEANAFLAKCGEMRNGIIFEFGLETGMRPEEYLALRWRDLAGREVSVQQVVQFNRKGGGFYFKEPKTKRGARRVPVSDALRQRLTVHRREQNEHRIAMKGTWFNHDLIFPDTIGRPLPINNLTRRYFRPIVEACGLEDRGLTLYGLRHTCATLLLMSGVNPKTVADRLGHASVVQTLDKYSHVLPHIQDDATEILDRMMRGVR